MKLTISNKEIEFQTDLNRITVRQFSEFDIRNKRIGKLAKEARRIAEELEAAETLNLEDADLMEYEVRLMEIDSQIRANRIEQLAILSTDEIATAEFLLNTKGITASIIDELFELVDRKFQDFQSWFDGVKPVKSFSFYDYKRRGWFGRKFGRYFVATPDRTTVLRDAGASVVAMNIEARRSDFQNSVWTNLASFVAYVARPENEVEEFSVTSNKRFVGGRKFERLNIADRLAFYNDKLTEAVKERTKIFQELPLAIAFGVYKQHFFFYPN